jgi:hypothetical protein
MPPFLNLKIYNNERYHFRETPSNGISRKGEQKRLGF